MVFLSSIYLFWIFYPIFYSDEIIISIGFHPFDIYYDNPILWAFIKKSFFIFHIFSTYNLLSYIFKKLFSKKQNQINEKISTNNPINNDKISLLIGENLSNNSKVFLPESGLYQNFLITGTIGSGKTSSALYPFTEQILEFNFKHPNNKIPILILDVKGNYFEYVKNLTQKFNLKDDLIEINLNSNFRYNPLDKPDLSPLILANRLKTILLLFSENNSESFWLDKAEQILAESIKLCRLYNNYYVTFSEIHNLIMSYDYYKSKLEIIRKLFYNSHFSKKELYDLNSCLNFFKNDFYALDPRTLAILRSEISRITNIFVSDFYVSKTFSPPKKDLTFLGFNHMLKKGQIVVLNMNIAEYKNLSKIIAAYLKLDFQTEILKNLAHKIVKTSVFICDEYQEYVTKTDADFFSLSRESKCINIISTQSYSSLKNTLKDENSVKVILQNLINKIWFRTDDTFTIEEIKKQIGKEYRKLESRSISENAKETNFNYITRSLNSKNSNISESLNTYLQKDFVYDSNFFSQNLETFYSLAFLSDGYRILPPSKLKMFPYFKK